jgi:hypothetical protein
VRMKRLLTLAPKVRELVTLYKFLGQQNGANEETFGSRTEGPRVGDFV